MNPSADKVLVVILDNLGDTVMATALIEPLRRHLPGVRIGVWAKSYSARVFEGQGLDFVHAADSFWDSSPGRGRGTVRDFLRVSSEVRAVGYGTALVLNTEWRRALACALSGVPRRIGFDQRKSRWFLTEAVPDPPSSHLIDGHRKLLELVLGRAVPASECLPKLVFSEAERRAGAEWVGRRSWQDAEVFVLHPFCADPLRCWPIERWRELIDRISTGSPRARFAIAGAPAEVAGLASQLAALPPGLAESVIPLEEVRGLLSLARAFVGGDSGIGHIAAAAGVPMVSLIGPASSPRHAVRGRGAIRILVADSLAGLGADVVAAELKALLS